MKEEEGNNRGFVAIGPSAFFPFSSYRAPVPRLEAAVVRLYPLRRVSLATPRLLALDKRLAAFQYQFGMAVGRSAKELRRTRTPARLPGRPARKASQFPLASACGNCRPRVSIMGHDWPGDGCRIEMGVALACDSVS